MSSYGFELIFSEINQQYISNEFLDELTYLNSFCSLIDIPIPIKIEENKEFVNNTSAYFNETESFRIKKILQKLQAICAKLDSTVFLDIIVFNNYSATDKLRISLKNIKIDSISTKLKKHNMSENHISKIDSSFSLRYNVIFSYSELIEVTI